MEKKGRQKVQGQFTMEMSKTLISNTSIQAQWAEVMYYKYWNWYFSFAKRLRDKIKIAYPFRNFNSILFVIKKTKHEWPCERVREMYLKVYGNDGKFKTGFNWE